MVDPGLGNLPLQAKVTLHGFPPDRAFIAKIEIRSSAAGHNTWSLQLETALARHWNRERKISPKFFRPKFFRGRPRGMSVPNCFFFRDLEGLTEVFHSMSKRDIRPKASSLGRFFVPDGKESDFSRASGNSLDFPELSRTSPEGPR